MWPQDPLPGARCAAGARIHYRFDRAAKLTMPVLVIAGGKDRLTDPAPVRPFVAALPHGRMIVYPEAGHSLTVDEAARFARDATAFLDR